MKVFISSTRDDLKAYRDALREMLLELSHEPLMLEIPHHAPDAWENACEMIADADVFIGIYAHRYGHLPKNQAKSLVEQELEFARKLGRETACYVISPKAAWPEKHREDDFIKRTRLEAFTENLRKNGAATEFRNKNDILSHLRPVLAKWSEKYDRLKRLNEWSRALPAAQKLGVLMQLSQQFTQKRLAHPPFVAATRLITENFAIDKTDDAYPLVDAVENLLAGKLSPNEFADKTRPASRTEITQLFRKNLYPKIAVIALPALVIGIVLGRAFFDRQPRQQSSENLPAIAAESRAKPASLPVETVENVGNAEKPTTHTQKTDNLVVAKIEKPKTAQHVAAKKTQKAAPRQTTAAPQKASQQPVQARKISNGSDAPSPPLQQDGVKKPETQADVFVEKKQKELIRATTAKQNASPPETPSQASATDRALSGAAIRRAENLLICENVNRETRMPEGIADTLKTATVWMWARITTQRPDSIKAEWRFNGQLLGVKTARVPVASPGYRIYFSRFIGNGVRGKGELKLYNGSGKLIGAREFWLDATKEN